MLSLLTLNKQSPDRVPNQNQENVYINSYKQSTLPLISLLTFTNNILTKTKINWYL